MNGDVGRLSARERTVAERYASGETYTKIAEALHIAPSTGRNHLSRRLRRREIALPPKPAPLRWITLPWTWFVTVSP